jgi:YHS domain-containing protein
VRFLLFLAICLLLYCVIRSLFGKRDRNKGTGFGSGFKVGKQGRTVGRPPPIEDELVQDPVCGVYTPKRTSVPLIWRGKALYFCSEECRRKFQERERGG